MTSQGGNGTIDVLLVEDNPGDVRLVREAFEGDGVDRELRVITDGESALDFLFRRRGYEGAPRPRLVILDLNLPRSDGLEVLEIVKSDPDLLSTPVVVLTGSEAEKDVAACYRSRANAYCTKPVDPDEFIALVSAIEEFWFERVRLPSPWRA